MMNQAYHDIGRKLNLPGWNDPTIDALKLVSEWLSNDEHGSWLLVLDNADDMETFFGAKSDPSLSVSEQIRPLVNYIPRSSNGWTIITTRDKRIGERLANREKPIEIVPMDRQEAERLLLSKVPPEYTLDNARLSELVELLGCLPLAITQAAAYISENSISVEDYLKAFEEADSEMQNLLSVDLPDHRRDFEMRSEMQNSVMRTWKVSFDQIRGQNPRAAEMLSLMAFFDRQGIPKMIIRRDGERGTDFTTALGMLQAFSLIAAEKGGESFKMHRLVQVSTQRWLEIRGEATKRREEALKVLSQVFPWANYKDWANCKALSPHVRIVTRYAFAPNLNLTLANLLYKVSSYAKSQGQYNYAYETGMDALSIRKKELGSEHRDTRASVYNLAIVLQRQGKYEVAEEMHRQVLALNQKALGPEHPETLNSMYSLGRVLYRQGKYEVAEEMHRHVLAIDQKVLGHEHPNTLSTIYSLAVVLQRQGKYEVAEEMYRQVLELRQKVLGHDHPSTIISMSHLGTVLHKQGKYIEAEKSQRQALEGFERLAGPDSPHAISSAHNLAETLRALKQDSEASILSRRAYLGYQERLGLDHPHTQISLKNYSSLLEEMKKS
jgi:tetratricopeptide (TPR) repeat protein